MRPKLLILAAIVLALAVASLIAVKVTPPRTTIPEPVTSAPVEATTGPRPTPTGSSDHTYSVVAHATSTVGAVMQEEQVKGALSFVTHEYTGLGSFLVSINDVASAENKYWMLYINGTRSSVGMTHALVVPGDHIEWRYE